MRLVLFGGAMLIALGAAMPQTSLEAPSPISGDQVQAGRKLAQDVCATCHDVSANQQFPPALLNPAPTFVSIANRPGTTRDSLIKFLATTHGDLTQLPLKMPEMMLMERQREAAAAYILTLRTPS